MYPVIINILSVFGIFILGVILGSITMTVFLRPHVKRIAVNYLDHYFKSDQFITDLKEFHVNEQNAERIRKSRWAKMDALLDRFAD